VEVKNSNKEIQVLIFSRKDVRFGSWQLDYKVMAQSAGIYMWIIPSSLYLRECDRSIFVFDLFRDIYSGSRELNTWLSEMRNVGLGNLGISKQDWVGDTTSTHASSPSDTIH